MGARLVSRFCSTIVGLASIHSTVWIGSWFRVTELSSQQTTVSSLRLLLLVRSSRIAGSRSSGDSRGVA